MEDIYLRLAVVEHALKDCIDFTKDAAGRSEARFHAEDVVKSSWTIWSQGELPPVGTICEANTLPDVWRVVKIVAHENGLAVFFWDTGDIPYCGAMLAKGFRPLA